MSLIRVCLLCFSLFCGTKSFAQVQSLKVATFPYPPYMLEGASTGLKGLEIDIFEAATRGLSLKVDYKFLPIRRAVLATRNTPEDWIYIGTGVHFKEELKNKKFSSVKIGNAKFVAYVLESSPLRKVPGINLQKIRRYKVAAIRGSSVVAALREAGIDTLEVTTFDQFFKVLEAQRVDASVVLELAGDYHIKIHKDNMTFEPQKIPGSLYQIPLSIVIPKAHPQHDILYSTISARVKKMFESGEIKKIAEHYYGPSKVPDDYFEKDQRSTLLPSLQVSISPEKWLFRL